MDVYGSVHGPSPADVYGGVYYIESGPPPVGEMFYLQRRKWSWDLQNRSFEWILERRNSNWKIGGS